MGISGLEGTSDIYGNSTPRRGIHFKNRFDRPEPKLVCLQNQQQINVNKGNWGN